MIETLKFENGEIYSMIIRSDYSIKNNINFITNEDDDFQLGFMHRSKGYNIEPHYHLKNNRSITSCSEVLLIKSGKIKVNFYNTLLTKIDDKILMKGDTIIFLKGGHGFEFIEDSEVIEVKQGPYNGINDKKRF